MKRVSSCLLGGVLAMVFAAREGWAQSIPNAGFEEERFSDSPGYAAENGGIPGWEATRGVGQNPAAGNPFANNGKVPQGVNVAFIQSSDNNVESLTTTITGLTPGTSYVVWFRANCRAGYSVPQASFGLNGGADVSFTAGPAVGGNNSYYSVAGTFTATSDSAALVVTNQTAEDTTLLVDDFSVAAIPAAGAAAWSVRPWKDDGGSGLTGTVQYARHFGSAEAADFGGVSVAGVEGANPSVPGLFTVTGVPNVLNGDANALTSITGSGSALVARDFVWGGSPATLGLQGLVPGQTYVLTLLSVGWDPVVSRVVTFSSGGRDFTVNQDQFGDNNGIRVDYTFVAGATTRVITIAPQTPGYTFHLYGLALRQAIMVVHTLDAGAGSLRGAMETAAAQPGEDMIAFEPGFPEVPITLLSEIALRDTGSVTVDAALLSGRVTISQTGGHRHFYFDSGTSVSLRGMIFVNGLRANGEAGGAIQNFGGLTVTDCVFSGNSAALGGAILSSPSAPANNASLTLTDCTFTGNTATEGAAIFNHGPMTLTRCAFSGNSSTANFGGVRGGAVLHYYGPLLVTQCTFSGNSTTGKGGGIYIGAINDADNSRFPATLTHCTFSGNSAEEAGGGIHYNNFLGFVTLTDSIVSGNTSPAGDVSFRGTLERAGTNIIQSAVGIENGVSNGPAALTGNPLLAPMGNYGGLTATMALRPGSPARNAATGPAITADQRGFPLTGLPDIGAYEAGTLTNCMANLAETVPASVAAARVGPDGDYDGDGASNLEECHALTNPADAASVFRIVSAIRFGANLHVTFTTVPGRKYTVEQSHNAMTGPWAWMVQAIPGDGTNKLVLLSLPLGGAPRWYYRVRATP